MALLERSVDERYRLSSVPMEFFRGSLELPLGFFQMGDRRLDAGMMLRRRGSGGSAGSRRGRAGLQSCGLRVKNQW
jgi:hypothetical protein